MAITCGIKCAKSVLIVVNIFIWLSGLVLVVLGAWLLLEPAKAYLLHLVSTPDTSMSLHIYLAYALLAVGAFIVIVGFFGCCGALHESRCLILTYYVFLMVTLIAEIAIAVACLVFMKNTAQGLEDRLLTKLRDDYGRDEQHNFSDALDFTQYKFNCCGILGDDDFTSSHWLNVTSLGKVKNVPATCCVLVNETASYYAGSPISVVSRVFYASVEEDWQNPQPRNDGPCQAMETRDNNLARHKKGCMFHIVKWLRREMSIVIITCLAVALIDIMCMVFSICLCRNLTTDI